ncbi:hypothetical protein [Flavobacterium sp.]|uniref:hypothetical protein n=1 Tax=Flavobacterium sp. TaxID=239 RepID=UPI0025EE3A00|nr:hypothetical protein [Flavobacterium sp.]
MKKILTVFILLTGFSAFSQGLTLEKNKTKEIKLENGRFYINGTQIPSYEMKKVFASNLHSVKLYKEAKSKEAIGGTLLGLGSAMTLVDLAIGLFSNVKYPTVLTYAGLSAIAVSIPILSGRASKINEAVKSYNDELKNTTAANTNFDINALVNQNGVGLQIKF